MQPISLPEGSWKWDGINTNTGAAFWNGQGAAGIGGGSAVGNAFVNWGGKSAGSIQEPDNYMTSTDQDGAAIALAGWPSGTTMLGIAGEWNDIAITNSIYFIIEKNNTGVNEINSINEIELFPNPANDFIQLKNVNDNNALIQILNSEGKLIKTLLLSDVSDNMIETSAFAKGIYFVKVITAQNNYSLKFIKQ